MYLPLLVYILLHNSKQDCTCSAAYIRYLNYNISYHVTHYDQALFCHKHIRNTFLFPRIVYNYVIRNWSGANSPNLRNIFQKVILGKLIFIYLWPFLFNQPITVKIIGWFNKEGHGFNMRMCMKMCQFEVFFVIQDWRFLRRLPTSLQ